jgi:integrase
MACIVKRRGRWVVDFRDHTGARRWKTLRKGLKKADAEEEMSNILEKVRDKTYLSNSKIPTFKKVAKDWLNYKKPKVRETYWEVLEVHVRIHFEDLDPLRINQITIPVLEKFITDRQEKKMHIATLRKVLVTLGQVLAYAVKNRYLNSNPLRDTERPRDVRHEGREMQILTPEQVGQLLENTPDRKYQTLFLFAVMTGARQGEILSLKWSDLDFDRKQVHIQRTGRDGRIFPTKTLCSNRWVDLSPVAIRELKKWRLESPYSRDEDLIFPTDTGNMMSRNNLVERYYTPALKKAKLPMVTFHGGLRHTYASLMIEQGENLKYIQTQLGHSSPTVTLNVYTHLLKPTNQEAVQRLENTIFANDGSKMVAETKKDLTANG